MISVYTRARLTALAISLSLIAGCANTLESLPIVFKPEVRQGTEFDEADVRQLESGMSERQVRAILGPPTFNDPFSSDRWDYAYSVDPRSTDLEPVSRRLTVFFENGTVASARGTGIEAGHPLYGEADSSTR